MLVLGGLGVLAAPVSAQQQAVHEGLCDASAAAALDATHFVVASDEVNTLFIFQRGRAAARATVSLDAFLDTEGKESDLEGVATVGRRLYWIGSHGRNRNGKERPERQRLFATEVDRRGAVPTLVPVGRPYRQLLDDLLAAPQLAPYRLREAARLAPEAPGGLNIEGLAATPQGQLLVGLRSPLRQGRALLVPIENPQEVVMGSERARLGTPVELDLGGRGIRSIERVGAYYFIVAGPTADEGRFQLYKWSGLPGEAPQAHAEAPLGDLRPEALFEMPTGTLQLLSDDGGIETAGQACKDLPAARQSFRSLRLPRPQ